MAGNVANIQNYGEVAERQVIGAILIDPSVLGLAREIVRPADFFSEINRVIFASMCSLDDASMPIDISTLYARLANVPIFNERGGVSYLMDCESCLPSAIAIERHANIIRADAIRRRLLEFGDKIKALASNPLEDTDETVALLGDDLLAIAEGAGGRPWLSFSDAVKVASATLVSGDSDGAVSSGFIDLDAKMTGFRPGALTIVAARPAMGKTAFGLNIMAHAAFDEGLAVAFFSLEMTAEELTLRTLSCRASVNGNALRQKTMDEAEWNRILDAAKRYSEAKIYIDETAGLDIAMLRERAKRMSRQYGIGLIIVDYLQLMTASAKKVQNREQEVATISRGLKGIAKELHIPVVALAQLNRAVDARADKRPVLSDLRESGSIEQDADNILFIHREDYYKPNAEQTNEAEIIIAKQRSGPTGIIKLHWAGQFTRFSNLSTRYP